VIQENLAEKVEEYSRNHNLFYPGEKVVVAVSGGADSVCLLHVLARLRSKLEINLHIAHLNHQLRGKESTADARYVAGIARRMKIPITIENKDVSAYKRQKRLSLEEAARELRYEFLARVASSIDAGGIAVAHTRDDDIETVLLHLIRGTGINGLRGLRPHSVLQLGEDRSCFNIIRPLLEITRAETVEYCQKLRIKPHFDPSNMSVTFTRNRIRHELLPVLRTYNPRFDDALLRLSAIAKEEMSFIEEQTSQLWSDIVEELGGILVVNIKKIVHLPVIFQRQLLRWAIKYLCGDTRDIESEHIEEMVNFLKKPTGKTLYLPHGLRLHTEYGRLIMNLEDTSVCPFPALDREYKIKIPGETGINGWHISARYLGRKLSGYTSGFVAVLDSDKTGNNLVVRASRTGDSLQPLGMAQTKSLRHFMADARIPHAWRNSVPLVCSPDKIIWVVGWRIDDLVKVTSSTRKVLQLKFERVD
jgi:tRNA(Ile)-lysidine synthase